MNKIIKNIILCAILIASVILASIGDINEINSYNIVSFILVIVGIIIIMVNDDDGNMDDYIKYN